MHGAQWAKQDKKEQKRFDRKADRDGDAELEAYNAMLAGLKTGENSSQAEYYRAEYQGDEIQGFMHSDKAKREYRQKHRE